MAQKELCLSIAMCAVARKVKIQLCTLHEIKAKESNFKACRNKLAPNHYNDQERCQKSSRKFFFKNS